MGSQVKKSKNLNISIKLNGINVVLPEETRSLVEMFSWMGTHANNMRTFSISYDNRFGNKFSRRVYLKELVAHAMRWPNTTPFIMMNSPIPDPLNRPSGLDIE
jgi:hypothetical protein